MLISVGARVGTAKWTPELFRVSLLVSGRRDNLDEQKWGGIPSRQHNSKQKRGTVESSIVSELDIYRAFSGQIHHVLHRPPVCKKVSLSQASPESQEADSRVNDWKNVNR